MHTPFVKAEEFVDHIKEYVNNRIASVKLQAAEKSSKVLSNIIAASIVGGIMLLFTIFLGVGAAYLLSEWIGTTYSGFLIVAGVYLLLALVIWMSKEKILRIPIMNKILQEMFKDEEDQ
jgi:uncharacterized RDD family membrane protein YckC